MLTVHLLTKNNADTIIQALDSIKSYSDKIFVGDFGSTDETVAICSKMGAVVHHFRDTPRNMARNKLASLSNDLNFWMEPWEIVTSGHKSIQNVTGDSYAGILTGNTFTKEIRFWKNSNFINPVYETIDSASETESNVVIFSKGRNDYQLILDDIQKWKDKEPLSAMPYYYEACTLLALNNYDSFIKVSEHFMFLNKTESMASTMNHFYYAMVQLLKYRSAKPALQNLNLCLCANPLMAEFWCLTGDVYYHLLHRFKDAREMYENAIIMGSRRLKSDKWPMDLAKYKSYPNKMIDSCDRLLATAARFVH